MSFPRYPEYKDSGVEWLGTVPVHWDLVPLKQVITRIESGTSVNAIDTPAGDGELGVLKTSCVYHGHFDADENKAVIPDEYDRVACPVTAGTLVVSRMNTPDLVGAAGVVHVSHENLFLPDRLWQVHFDGADPNFVHHWTHTPAYRAQVEMACAGTSSSMQNLGQDQFRCFVIPRPSYSEQTAIATFLDRETSKIDALVAEQEKLIALLQEKRQAVISHAVTKGLDPNVPMKDSGVEWLGEVPGHWEVKRLKQLCDEPLKYGANEAAELDDPSLPRFVRITDVTESGALRDETFRSLPREIAEPFLLREGDVLLARSGGTVGKSFMYQRHWGEACFAGYLIRVRLSQRLCVPQWLNYFCRTDSYWGYVLGSQIQSTIQNVSAEKYANMFLPVPSIEEQQLVIAFLDQATSKIDDLVTEARTAITLLQERRTALISAAVTGQIDVRSIASREVA